MSRKYRELTQRHCRVLCNTCNVETTLKLKHYEVIIDEITTERISWMCSLCNNSENAYTPFTVAEFREITDNSLELRSRMIPRIHLSKLFPDGLVFRQNEAFHTLLQEGNIAIARNRLITETEKNECAICYTDFLPSCAETRKSHEFLVGIYPGELVGKDKIETPCRHFLCSQCWLRSKPEDYDYHEQCPVCSCDFETKPALNIVSYF